MASPLTKKYKWPSDKKKQSNFDGSDFVPYVSNIANMFRKVPRPMAPDLVDPIVNQRVSLAGAKAQTEEASRSADLATQGLDAQTGAAIRTGNLATRLRSLNDLSSREAMINTQATNQTNAINANIDAQNTGITNAYRDDLVNAQLTQNRLGAENLANASDKYIAQAAAKDQIQLEKDKTAIMSRIYNPGVYNRLATSLAKDGIDVAKTSQPFVSSFSKYKNMQLPNLATPASTSLTKATPTVPYDGTGPLLSKGQEDIYPEVMRKKPRPKYLMQKYAAGGMMDVFGGDPKPKIPVPSVAKNASYTANQTDRDAGFVDGMSNMIAKGFDPYTSDEGNSIVRHEASTFYSPQFASDLGTRVKAFQTSPGYQTMTPEQRISSFYDQAKGDSELDQFLRRTKSFGGNPAAFYQGNKMRKYGGKLTKPFA